MSAIGMHMPTVPTDIQYETYNVVASQVELDVFTGTSRVLKTHIRFATASRKCVDQNRRLQSNTCMLYSPEVQH